MILDGRNGAYGMIFNRVVTNPVSLPANLLAEAKTALYITDESFNDKISLLCFDAIYDFERITSTSILPQTIKVYYQYFKGKNRVPFGPHVSIESINNTNIDPTKYVIAGITGNLYLECLSGYEPVLIEVTTGYTAVPPNIRRTLVKMVECMFRNERYSQVLNAEIRSYSQWMD
jgi:hypothetical protein